MHEPTPPSSTILREQLIGEHAHFEVVSNRIVAAMEAQDFVAVLENWRELVTRIRMHFETEEKFLIPVLLDASLVHTRTIIQEHRHIRDRIDELEEAFESGTARLEAMRVFVGELRAHLMHEDSVLYTRVSLDPEELGALLRAAKPTDDKPE